MSVHLRNDTTASYGTGSVVPRMPAGGCAAIATTPRSGESSMAVMPDPSGEVLDVCGAARDGRALDHPNVMLGCGPATGRS